MQKNEWEVGRTLEATLLFPSNIPPTKYGWIYRLFLGPPKSRKQYEITINDCMAYSCVDFFSMMSRSLIERGSWVPCRHLYDILQYAMYIGIKEPFIHYPSWSWNEVHRLLNHAKILEIN